MARLLKTGSTWSFRVDSWSQKKENSRALSSHLDVVVLNQYVILDCFIYLVLHVFCHDNYSSLNMQYPSHYRCDTHFLEVDFTSLEYLDLAFTRDERIPDPMMEERYLRLKNRKLRGLKEKLKMLVGFNLDGYNGVLSAYITAVSVEFLHLDPNIMSSILKKNELDGLLMWCSDLMEELLQKIIRSKDKSTTFDFVLKVIDKVQYCRYLPLFVIFGRLKSFISYAQAISARFSKNEYHRILLKILKVFIVRVDVFREFLSNCPVNLAKLLLRSQKQNFHMFNLWSVVELGSEEHTHSCLFNNLKNFIIFLQFGGKNTYSWSSFREFRFWFLTQFCPTEQYSEERNIDELYLRTRFRVLQVFCLFSRHSRTNYLRTERALKTLWSSIPDPFLNFYDFILFANAHECSNLDVREVIVLSGRWYHYQIYGDKPVTCQLEPRSLRHLARCAVKSQMALSFQYPRGLKRLFIPKLLSLYLRKPHLDLH